MADTWMVFVNCADDGCEHNKMPPIASDLPNDVARGLAKALNDSEVLQEGLRALVANEATSKPLNP